jgi:peptide deformylase
MAKKESAIVQEGDPVLRGKAKSVPLSDITTKPLQQIIVRMKTALAGESDGVAIAAPQIGVSLRIFVVSAHAFEIANEEKAKKDKKIVSPTPGADMICINPEITKLSKKKKKVPEGCLSVRWKYGTTMRHEKATLTAYNENGIRFTYGGSGLIAQIFQHETDHLNGTLFIDHATDIETLTPEQIADAEKKNKSLHGE